MKSWIQTFFLLSSLFLTACSHFQDSSIYCDQKSLNEKATIVLEGTAPFTTWLFSLQGRVNVTSIWERIDPPANSDKKIEYRLSGFPKDHMVFPGTYRMTRLEYTIGKVAYNIVFPKSYPITFTVASGDFIYLGHIIIKDADREEFTPLLEDNYEKETQRVKEDFPEIKKPLEKRLIEGLEPGKWSDIVKE